MKTMRRPLSMLAAGVALAIGVCVGLWAVREWRFQSELRDAERAIDAGRFKEARSRLARLDFLKRKKRKPFEPEVHGLERRMMLSQFTVSNTNDSGSGSLRQAIINSNASPAVVGPFRIIGI